MCFQCKYPKHCKNECPKLIAKKKFFKDKKKVLIATWDDSEAFEDDSEEEQAHMALMASAEAFDSRSKSDSDP